LGLCSPCTGRGLRQQFGEQFHVHVNQSVRKKALYRACLIFTILCCASAASNLRSHFKTLAKEVILIVTTLTTDYCMLHGVLLSNSDRSTGDLEFSEEVTKM
jgi:hypothetical protein